MSRLAPGQSYVYELEVGDILQRPVAGTIYVMEKAADKVYVLWVKRWGV